MTFTSYLPNNCCENVCQHYCDYMMIIIIVIIQSNNDRSRCERFEIPSSFNGGHYFRNESKILGEKIILAGILIL